MTKKKKMDYIQLQRELTNCELTADNLIDLAATIDTKLARIARQRSEQVDMCWRELALLFLAVHERRQHIQDVLVARKALQKLLSKNKEELLTMLKEIEKEINLLA